MSKQHDQTHVYMIAEDTGLVKIGIAKDPDKRLKQLQTGNPNALWIVYAVPMPLDQAKQTEARMHQIYKSYRATGEWFDLSAEDVIEAMHLLASGVSDE